MFLIMQKIRINEKFVDLVKLLFGIAYVAVNFHNNPCSMFKIKRGVRQGCPLAPYMFLVVGEILTHIIKKAVLEGGIIGSSLPWGKKQQSILQYADDSSFMGRGERRFIDELVWLLKKLTMP